MPYIHLDNRTLQAIAAISGALLVGLTSGNTAASYIWPTVSKPIHIATRDALTSALIEKHEELEREQEENQWLKMDLEQCHVGVEER